VAAELGSLDTVKHLVAHGFGFAIASRAAILNEIRPARWWACPSIRRCIPLEVIILKDKFRSRLVNTFADFVIEEIARLSTEPLARHAPSHPRLHRPRGPASQLSSRPAAGRQRPGLAVVKANAYGHGIGRAIQALGGVADGFALLDLAEARGAARGRHHRADRAARRLLRAGRPGRRAGPRPHPGDPQRSPAGMLERAALAGPIDVLVKINTGMNRLGFTADTFAPALARLRPCRRCAASR
jgi:hypothetical protein